MQLIPRDQLVIRDRQRKQILAAPLNELKEDIARIGLLHPPVVYKLADNEYLLVAGERRTKAIDLLAAEQRVFACGHTFVSPGFIPVLVSQLDDDADRQEAELSENIIRVDLTWQERAAALASIHAMRLERNPAQTIVATAEEISQASGQPAVSLRRNITDSVLIAEHLDDPKIAKARTHNEARTLILRKEEDRVNSILASRRLATLPERPDIEVRHADLTTYLPTVAADDFDLILADPPYGIGAHVGGFRSRTVQHHNYEDTPENARRIAECILVEGFRLSRPRSNLFLFCDIKNWDWLIRSCARVGWAPFPRPLIWGKSDSEGLAPWGSSGPRITTEFILFATKGKKGLLASPIDYIRVNRVPRHERIHAAEKPVELIRRLLECSTLPGDRVLDPCCGSGSTLIACKELGRRALGVEADEGYYNTAMSNVHMKGGEIATDTPRPGEPVGEQGGTASGDSGPPSQLPL